MPVSIITRITLVCCAVAVVSMTNGCTTLTNNLQSANDALPWNTAAAAARKVDATAVRIAAVWTHDVMNVAGKNPVQGFGGRIYFYNHEQEAIKVEGELVVFAFDDTSMSQKGEATRNPDRKFIFRADQLPSHLSDSEMGPSYSFWIPWQEFGGDQRLISLVPVFMPTEGRNVTGHFSKTSLPGRLRQPPNMSTQDQLTATPPARQGLQTKTISREQYPTNLKSKVTTTTFDVPKNLTRHLVTSTAMPVHQAPVTPVRNQPKFTSAVSAVEQIPQAGTSSQPYRALTSPSGLQAIKLMPPSSIKNATQH